MCKHKFMTFGVDGKGPFRICCKCHEKVYTSNNADKIRATNDNELLDFLFGFQVSTLRDAENGIFPDKDGCKEWLEMERTL